MFTRTRRRRLVISLVPCSAPPNGEGARRIEPPVPTRAGRACEPGHVIVVLTEQLPAGARHLRSCLRLPLILPTSALPRRDETFSRAAPAEPRRRTRSGARGRARRSLPSKKGAPAFWLSRR